MFSESIHNPMLMDRYLSLKATKYVYTACKRLGDEISFQAGRDRGQARRPGIGRGTRAPPGE